MHFRSSCFHLVTKGNRLLKVGLDYLCTVWQTCHMLKTILTFSSVIIRSRPYCHFIISLLYSITASRHLACHKQHQALRTFSSVNVNTFAFEWKQSICETCFLLKIVRLFKLRYLEIEAAQSLWTNKILQRHSQD